VAYIDILLAMPPVARIPHRRANGLAAISRICL
jgi:hypothetical protein